MKKTIKRFSIPISILGVLFLISLKPCHVVAQSTPSYRLTVPSKSNTSQVQLESNSYSPVLEVRAVDSGMSADSLYMNQKLNSVIAIMNSAIVTPQEDEIRKVNTYRKALIKRDRDFEEALQSQLYVQKIEINRVENDSSYQRHRKVMIALKELRMEYEKRTENDWNYFYKYRHFKRNESCFVFLPSLDNIGAQVYYSNGLDSQNFLNNSGITLNSKLRNTGVYSEIYHDYVGPFRLAISAAFSSENDGADSLTSDSLSTQNGMLSRLLTSGGNVVVNGRMPLFTAQSRLGYYSFRSNLGHKLGFDVQANDESAKNPNFVYEGSVDGMISLIGIKKKLSVFIYGKSSLIYGNSTFNSLIGFNKRQLVSLNQVSLGMEIANFMRISYSMYGGTQLIKDNFESGINLTYLSKF